MNNDNIKEFWKNRADKYDITQSYNITNLEENKKLQKIKIDNELQKISNIFSPSKNKILLDLGSGLGFWSFKFAAEVKKVIAVDFVEKMNLSVKREVEKLNIYNLELVTSDVVDFIPNIKIDYVFLSGVLLYLNDQRALKLIKNIYSYTNNNSEVLVRDATGLNGRYVIKNKYSEALKSNYSAIYRSKKEIITLFETNGFVLKYNDDMFKSGSPLNKWDETRLRVYLFKRRK